MERRSSTRCARLSASCAMAVACAGAHAQSGVTLSGFVDLNIEHLRASGAGGNRTGVSSGGLNNSRFNISGFEELGNGNRAMFTIEPMFSADTGAQSAQFRQSFVGLKGNWGTLTLGRQFTPSFWIAGYADPSYAAAFSMVNNMQFFYSSYRVDNAVNYTSPSFGGFTVRAMYGAGAEDGTRSGRFLSASLEYRNGPLYLGAVSQLQRTRDIFQPSQIRTARDNFVSMVYRVGNLEPTISFHNYSGYYAYPPYVAFDSQGWDVQAGVRWKINDRHRIFASLVHRHDDHNQAISNATGGVLGYIYSLSRRTDLYGTVAHVQHRNKTPVPYPVTWQAYPEGGQNPTGFQLGIRHAF
ncbi:MULTISPECIES: porin [unclassified Pigmentiphaga]|uniref:porin n=1 Tax=unclassified Pigmentiphaga TaxID=2626614 RepID=UPI000B40FDB3|nr:MULTISPECIES: porin [unclassified Pigmentiphaga]OVZ65032.1 porin [Pigmentiphaga sp. NML030171]